MNLNCCLVWLHLGCRWNENGLACERLRRHMFSTVTGITKQPHGELTTPWQAGKNKVNYGQYYDKPVKSSIFVLARRVCSSHLEKPTRIPLSPSASSVHVRVHTCVSTCRNARRRVLPHVLAPELPRCVSHRVEKERNRRGSSRRSRGSRGRAGQRWSPGPGGAGLAAQLLR